jgi:hypothetical protein
MQINLNCMNFAFMVGSEIPPGGKEGETRAQRQSDL